MKKTIAIISIAVLALIVAATVILAVIQKTFYNPIPSTDDISFIRVYKGDGTCQEFYNNSQDVEDQKVFDKLIDLHEESLKENILSSMFQGALSFNGGIKTEAVTGDTFNANLQGSNPDASSTYIEICYSQNSEQLLKYDGKTFTDADGDTVTYTKLIIEVNPSNYMDEVRAFVIKANSTGFKPESAYHVKFIAHQKALYKYIQELDLIGTVPAN